MRGLPYQPFWRMQANCCQTRRFMLVCRGQTVEYRCGNCDIAPKKSKAGTGHPHSKLCTPKKALGCEILLCIFYMPNFDSCECFSGHVKEFLTRTFLCVYLWVQWSQLPHPWGWAINVGKQTVCHIRLGWE